MAIDSIFMENEPPPLSKLCPRLCTCLNVHRIALSSPHHTAQIVRLSGQIHMETLSEEARREIANSTESASDLSEKYGVTVEDIESLRTFSSDFDDFEEESPSEEAPPEPSSPFDALSLKLRRLIETHEQEVALALDEMTKMILEKAEHVQRKIEMCEQVVCEVGVE